MDKNMKAVYKKRIEKTIKNLKRRNINGYYVHDLEQLKEQMDDLIVDKSSVAVGGSMTLFETGIIDYLRSRDLEFHDRYEEGLDPAQMKALHRSVFSSDVFISGTNAITEDGEIYNVDGSGNRVAPMIYGPDKVVVIVGANKIVKNLEEARNRNKYIAAPANVQRLQMKTPCLETGACTECLSPQRICNIYTVIDRQFDPNRLHVIFLNNSYGY
ncbi:lactate utilization protein [Acidaminobacter sp. JC074]|uniref:lactate utilization protein n=1 Tax=Acidaminobacter sp. JC074 TaxID=2530199 RepID=UPI001F0EB26F|nr:lactate utilization protein [Acidaminobacter sp. JC074]MCH4885996.1 lactate utilization protein [Acidaminobacter sp. JC074]